MNTTIDQPPQTANRLETNHAANGVPAIQSAGRSGPEKRIQELLERAQLVVDDNTRDLVHECLYSLLTLYGDGLARILQLIKNTGPQGESVREALLRDHLVRSLLLVHGLHPVNAETRLRQALDKIRPYLQSHGGNVELLGIENDIARLRLQGTCKTCPSSSITLELAVRQVITEACPDLAGFEVEGVPDQPETPAPGPCLASKNDSPD